MMNLNHNPPTVAVQIPRGDRMGCASSTVVEDFVATHGDKGDMLSKACEEAFFIDE